MIKNFDHHDPTAKIVILGAQGLLMLMGSKFDHAAKHCYFYLNVLQPSHLYQKF